MTPCNLLSIHKWHQLLFCSSTVLFLFVCWEKAINSSITIYSAISHTKVINKIQLKQTRMKISSNKTTIWTNEQHILILNKILTFLNKTFLLSLSNLPNLPVFLSWLIIHNNNIYTKEIIQYIWNLIIQKYIWKEIFKRGC